MRHLPSPLRAREKQESWLALFRAAAAGMAAGFPPGIAAATASPHQVTQTSVELKLVTSLESYISSILLR